MRSGSSCQIYFMTLNKPGLANWWRILTAMEIFKFLRVFCEEIHQQDYSYGYHCNISPIWAVIMATNAPFLSCTMANVTNWAITMAKFTIMSCRNESMDFKMSEILHRSEMCSYINCTLNIFFSKCNEFISSFHNQRRWHFPALSC